MVMRTSKNPYPVSICSGAGLLLTNYTFRNGIIKTQIEGAGLNRLIISAEKAPVVVINGKKLKPYFNNSAKQATIELILKYGKPLTMEIRNN